MANKNIEVNTDTLKTVHGKSAKELEQMVQTQLKEMKPRLDGLSEVWEGPNHDEFTKIVDGNMLALQSFNKSITSFLSAWQQAYRAYDECESSVSQQIG